MSLKPLFCTKTGTPFDCVRPYKGVVKYNPYTGRARDKRDMLSDPAGVLIVAPQAALFVGMPERMRDALCPDSVIRKTATDSWFHGEPAAKDVMTFLKHVCTSSPSLTQTDKGYVIEVEGLRVTYDKKSGVTLSKM